MHLSMLDGLGREASAAFFPLTLSRREQSPLVNVRPSASSIGRGYVGPRATRRMPLRESGKRASNRSVSTSANAFELLRISSDVLSRMTDAASN
jgi:hypothetical protein